MLIISTFLNFSPSFQFLRPTIPIRALAYRTAMTSYGSSMELAFDLFWKSKRFSTVTNYWRMLMGCRNLPPYINGDEEFGVTNLLELHEAGMRGEFTSKDSRYTSRKTYALRVGYDGTAYSGFQSQRNWDILTVEDDLKKITGKRVVAAGRTDRNVSALSQVVCYTVDDDLIEAELLEKVKSSEAFRQQRLTVYDVRRVPRSFNSRSCATWRRYLYLLPLDPGIYTMGYDVDVGFVNDCLNRYVCFSLLTLKLKHMKVSSMSQASTRIVTIQCLCIQGRSNKWRGLARFVHIVSSPGICCGFGREHYISSNGKT